MLNKLINIYIIITIFIIIIFHSKFLSYIWVENNLWVSGTFEFTKSIISNILLSLLWIIFFIKNYNKKIIIPRYIFFLFILFFYSLISSSFFYTNIFWNEIKWQGLIFFSNLIIFLLILINIKKTEIKKIINIILLLSVIPLFIAIKEYFLPSFDYWNLSNRALWTFWHPNFLALYIIIFIPLILEKIKQNKFYILIFLFFTFTLLLTKSIIAISLFIIYLFYFFVKNKKISQKTKYIVIIIAILSSIYIIYKFWFITKLNSFISRYYIWETTIKIIFSDLKNIIFWLWNDSLFYLFEKYKSSELYIFENIWYSADRPHNIILYTFISFGLLWLSFLSYFLYTFKKKFKKQAIYFSILIFIIFCLFNFASVATYLLIIIFIAYIARRNNKKKNHYAMKIFLITISFMSIFSSIIYYLEQNKIYNNDTYISDKKIVKNIYLENPENKIFYENNNIENICNELTIFSQSVETYFYCWNNMYYSNRERALKYYKAWLEKLPDMYNSKSNYYNNILIKNIFNYDRFISPRYSNLEEILNRVKNNQ